MSERPSETQIAEWYGKTDALLKGHFKLCSGRHSEVYLEKFAVLQHPEYTTRLCAAASVSPGFSRAMALGRFRLVRGG
jgi:orotate phosphoribosyltransferase